MSTTLGTPEIEEAEEEITEDLHESAYTIRAGLRVKVNALFEGEDSYEHGKEGEKYRGL